mgnify:CR=1 FL=1
MKKWLFPILGASVIIAIGLTAYFLTRPWAFPKTQNQSETPRDMAPDFSLVTLDGTTVTLSEFRNKKAVVLNFWGSWCPNCHRNMPKLSDMAKKYDSSIQVLGVNISEHKARVQNFQQKYAISFPLLLDDDGTVARLYGVDYTNTHILISKDGKRIGIVNGDMTEDKMKELAR